MVTRKVSTRSTEPDQTVTQTRVVLGSLEKRPMHKTRSQNCGGDSLYLHTVFIYRISNVKRRRRRSWVVAGGGSSRDADRIATQTFAHTKERQSCTKLGVVNGLAPLERKAKVHERSVLFAR